VITDFDDTRSPPDGYHRETRIRKGLVIGGAVTFGVVYTLTVLAASAANDSRVANAGALYAPVVGPLLFMQEGGSSFGNTFLVLNSLAQAAGATMLIYGLACPKTVLVRNDLGVSVTPTPMRVGVDGGGFGVLGTF